MSLVAYVFLSAAFGFIIKGIAGFGDPLISTPLLTMKLNNRDITPGMLPISLALNAYIAFKNRKNFSIKAVAPIAIFVVLGLFPGTWLLKMGVPWILKVVLGLYIIGLGVEMLTRDRAKARKPNIVIQSLMSFLSGITAGLFGINLLFLVYLERTAKDRNEFRGSMCFVFFIENFCRCLVYIANGIFTELSLKLSLIFIPAAVLGMWIGGRIDLKLSEAKVRFIIIWIFIAGGISACINAFLQMS